MSSRLKDEQVKFAATLSWPTDPHISRRTYPWSSWGLAHVADGPTPTMLVTDINECREMEIPVEPTNINVSEPISRRHDNAFRLLAQ